VDTIVGFRSQGGKMCSPAAYVLAPNHRWRRLVTPARRGKGKANDDSIEVKSPAERHVAMTWAQRLTRVFNIDKVN
jgi:hypothetical protein